MRLTGRLLRTLPPPLRKHLFRRREAVKFLAVGGFCWILTAVINYGLKVTVFPSKPVTALTLATIIAAFVSYALNREWTFRTRGGRRAHHELALYIVINGIGIALNSAPLYLARYAFALQTPHVSRTAQEISDFVWGMIIGTLLAMVFRLWAYRKWVFPQADARSSKLSRRNRAAAVRSRVVEPPADVPDRRVA
ncbi:GtrA family protein [Asanoa iriomotensis]|uniref:Sugar translocase n=1 Tax=Asanoa iriomotensis TaxID=234613 RepID=A0ABQ4C9C3_9ACTN|nr:GtrA family protein [Asanoa iriomotensis]GIF59386.1 sugar translocase [Asanoa iriomotensis]